MKQIILIFFLLATTVNIIAQYPYHNIDENTSTKAFPPKARKTLISINPSIGSTKLFINSVVNDNIKDDSTLTWTDVTNIIIQYQIAGGDLWCCTDPWGVYVNGYWSGIGATDLYYIRDYLTRLVGIDLSRTVLQSEGNSEKYVFPEYALCGASSIGEVKLPRKTTKIGKSAFKNCSRLICINGSCFYISNSRSVKNYYSEKPFSSDVDMSVFGEVDLSGLHDENEIIDKAFENLIEICDSAFWGTRITKVQLPKSIKKIGDEVFGNCNIREVTFFSDENITIGTNAFGKNEKDSVILYVNKEVLTQFKSKFSDRFKAIRHIGYISPNPIKIKLSNSKLIVDINEAASETGYIIDNDNNKIELNNGHNSILLNKSKSYTVIVGDEKFKLNNYNF